MDKIKKTKPRDWKTLFVLAGIAAVFFIIGMQLFPVIFEFVIPHVDGVTVAVTEISVMFKLSMLMGFAFAIIPFAVNSGWKLLKIESIGMRGFFALIILLGPLIALIIRANQLYYDARELQAIYLVFGNKQMIYASQINAAESVMTGTVGSWILAMAMFALFKKKPTAGSSPKTKL